MLLHAILERRNRIRAYTVTTLAGVRHRSLAADSLQLSRLMTCLSKFNHYNPLTTITHHYSTKMKDIICIGHITKDRVVTPSTETYMPGGASFYFSHAFSCMDAADVSYGLIVSLAEEDMEAVHELRSKGIETHVVPSRHTVFFENIYGDNPDERTQRVRAKADPFTIEALSHVEARYIVLGSLLADDFSLDVIRHLSQRGTLVVDAQGYLREVHGESVCACDWDEKLEALKYIDVLKVNEHEAEVLTGKSDLREAALQLAAWGVKEVLLTLGSLGSIVLCEGRFYDVPAYKPRRLVDATGCGDTYVMGYTYKRAQGQSPYDAALFASAASAIKLENSGPLRGTEKDVLERMAEARKD